MILCNKEQYSLCYLLTNYITKVEHHEVLKLTTTSQVWASLNALTINQDPWNASRAPRRPACTVVTLQRRRRPTKKLIGLYVLNSENKHTKKGKSLAAGGSWRYSSAATSFIIAAHPYARPVLRPTHI